MKNLFITASLALALLFGAANAQEAAKKTLGSTPAKTEKKVETKKEDGKKTLPAKTVAPKADAKSAKTAPKKAVKPVKGTIVSISNLAMGGTGKVTKDQAEKLVSNGEPFALKVGAKIYFVLNSDGTYAGKKIVKFAHNKFVGIIGKTKTAGGLNVIIMDDIQPMD